MRLLAAIMFFSMEVSAKPCLVKFCTPTGSHCVTKLVRQSGRIDVPQGHYVVSGKCR